MLVSISGAEKVLGDLVSKVEAGEEVVLTRQGRAVAHLASLDRPPRDRAGRRAVLEAARRGGRPEATGTGAAPRSQDVLYVGDGTRG